MATTPQAVTTSRADPQRPSGEGAPAPVDALHPHGGYDEGHEIPMIVRGEGSYVYDEHDNRYLDGLSALFCVNAGHGRAELGEAAARRPRSSASTRTGATRIPKAIELAARIAEARPGRPQPRVLHLGRLGGGRVGVEAGAPVPQAQRQPAEVQDHLARDRLPRHHLRRALDHGHHAAAHAVRAARTRRHHVPNTNEYRWAEDRDPLWAADQIEHMIEFQGPETVAAVILEPVQNSGGCFVPQDGYWQRVREICDRHNVLLIADEVICSWGRLGHYFGVERFGVVPDMITTAKGLTSAYAPMGAVIVPTAWPSRSWTATTTFTHGITFGGHPVSAAVALANLDIFEREDLCGHVREKEAEFRGDARQAEGGPPDRRRRARRRATSRRSSWSRTRRPRRASPTRSARSCCAASCRASSTSAG